MGGESLPDGAWRVSSLDLAAPTIDPLTVLDRLEALIVGPNHRAKPVVPTRQLTASSNFRGVSSQGSRWRARICVEKSERTLGDYDTETAAAVSYDREAILHGKLRTLNFVYRGINDRLVDGTETFQPNAAPRSAQPHAAFAPSDAAPTAALREHSCSVCRAPDADIHCDTCSRRFHEQCVDIPVALAAPPVESSCAVAASAPSSWICPHCQGGAGLPTAAGSCQFNRKPPSSSVSRYQRRSVRPRQPRRDELYDSSESESDPPLEDDDDEYSSRMPGRHRAVTADVASSCEPSIAWIGSCRAGSSARAHQPARASVGRGSVRGNRRGLASARSKGRGLRLGPASGASGRDSSVDAATQLPHDSWRGEQEGGRPLARQQPSINTLTAGSNRAAPSSAAATDDRSSFADHVHRSVAENGESSDESSSTSASSTSNRSHAVNSDPEHREEWQGSRRDNGSNLKRADAVTHAARQQSVGRQLHSVASASHKATISSSVNGRGSGFLGAASLVLADSFSSSEGAHDAGGQPSRDAELRPSALDLEFDPPGAHDRSAGVRHGTAAAAPAYDSLLSHSDHGSAIQGGFGGEGWMASLKAMSAAELTSSSGSPCEMTGVHPPSFSVATAAKQAAECSDTIGLLLRREGIRAALGPDLERQCKTMAVGGGPRIHSLLSAALQQFIKASIATDLVDSCQITWGKFIEAGRQYGLAVLAGPSAHSRAPAQPHAADLVSTSHLLTVSPTLRLHSSLSLLSACSGSDDAGTLIDAEELMSLSTSVHLQPPNFPEAMIPMILPGTQDSVPIDATYGDCVFVTAAGCKRSIGECHSSCGESQSMTSNHLDQPTGSINRRGERMRAPSTTYHCNEVVGANSFKLETLSEHHEVEPSAPSRESLWGKAISSSASAFNLLQPTERPSRK